MRFCALSSHLVLVVWILLAPVVYSNPPSSWLLEQTNDPTANWPFDAEDLSRSRKSSIEDRFTVLPDAPQGHHVQTDPLIYEVQLPSDETQNKGGSQETRKLQVVIEYPQWPLVVSFDTNVFEGTVHSPRDEPGPKPEKAVKVAPSEEALFWGADLQKRVKSDYVLPVEFYFKVDGYYDDEEKPTKDGVVVMEKFIPNLDRWLEENVNSDDFLKKRTIVIDRLIKGLHDLHSQGIAHRGIKPSSILVDKKENIYFTNFGSYIDFLDHPTSSNWDMDVEPWISPGKIPPFRPR